MKGNAKQISSKDSINLLRFVFFQELTESEYAAYKELVKKEMAIDEVVMIIEPVLEAMALQPEKKEVIEVKEPDKIEQVTERAKQYEPPTRRLTQEERHIEILKRLKKQ